MPPEAVSALDVSVQAQVLELLDDIRHRLELAMLFITHDLRVAAQVCDTVAVMCRGEVVEYGPVGEVFSEPRHDYTRALFAAAGQGLGLRPLRGGLSGRHMDGCKATNSLPGARRTYKSEMESKRGLRGGT